MSVSGFTEPRFRDCEKGSIAELFGCVYRCSTQVWRLNSLRGVGLQDRLLLTSAPVNFVEVEPEASDSKAED